MIKVEVEEYCQQCLDFEPEVEKPVAAYTDSDRYIYFGDTIVRCEYRHRCKTMAQHIKVTTCGHGGDCYIGECGKNGIVDPY